MIRFLLFLTALLIIVLSNSCATITKQERYTTKIQSDNVDAKLLYNDQLYQLPTQIDVKRSKEDLELILVSDSLKKKFLIKSRLSPTFLYGNLALLYAAPVGYLIDLTNQKRFYYGDVINLNFNANESNISESSNINLLDIIKSIRPEDAVGYKNKFNINLSFPWVNWFRTITDGRMIRKEFGFLGVGLGVNYFYKNNYFIEFQTSTITSYFLPVPAPMLIDGNYAIFSNNIISLTNNYLKSFISLGYGIQSSWHTWKYFFKTDSTTTIEDRIIRKNASLGFEFNFYFQPLKDVFLGIVYRPSIYTVAPYTKFTYQYSISLDMKLKFNIF